MKRKSLCSILAILAGSFIALAVPLYVAGEEISETVSAQAESTQEAFLVKPDTFSAETLPPVLEPSSLSESYVPDAVSVEAMAKMLYGEARGIKSDAEKAACCWCVLNRVDSPTFPDTVLEVVSQPHQFDGYSADYPIWPELEALAEDVLRRWGAEKNGEENVGRVLPPEYLYFVGDGKHNRFSVEWKSKDYWDWALPDPYESE